MRRVQRIVLACLAGAPCACTAPAGVPPASRGPAAVESKQASNTGTLEDFAHLLTSVGEAQVVAGFVEERAEDLPRLWDDPPIEESAPVLLEEVPAPAQASERARDDSLAAEPPLDAPAQENPSLDDPPDPRGLAGAQDPPLDVLLPEPVGAEERSANPYLEFGERILVHPDGRITKPYPISPQKGAKLLQLMLLYGPFELRWARVGPDSKELLEPEGLGLKDVGLNEVEVILLEGWDLEFFEDLRSAPGRDKPDAAAVAIADWFMVTARPSLLREVESFVNTFLSSVPQIEIEAKIIEIAEEDVLDYGVSAPEGLPVFDFPPGTLVDSFTYNLANSVAGQEAVLNLGAIQDETVFNLVLDALATWENVTINSQPKIVVREGARADIAGTEEIPFFNITGINPAGGFSAGVVYKPVGVQLYVIPRVLGTNTVSLQIDLESSQVTGSSITFTQTGVANEKTEISAPRIANRNARTVVHLEPGQAVILGGLTSEETQERIEKVPLLGDIPFLGALFKNRFTRTRRVHVLFFIRPRILQGIEFQHAGAYGQGW